MKKLLMLLLGLSIVLCITSQSQAQVNYDVIIEYDGAGENPAFNTWVMFEFGVDTQWAQVEDIGGNVGRARIVRAAWWGNDWSATINAALIPIAPAQWSQTQGGANNVMHWDIDD